MITDQRPNGATDYARIDATPEVLDGILALLGLAVLGRFAAASARRRRRDFAIMKALGLLRGQLIAVTAWQVTALTGLALLSGCRWGWRPATGPGGFSRPPPGYPRCYRAEVPLVLLMVPAAILAANAIAFPSGQLTARLHPAAALRAE